MTRLLVIAATAALALAAAASASAPSASIAIRHQMHGCHAWSVNGGAFKYAQSVKIRVGGTIVFTDNDVMPHKLVQVAGPRARLVSPSMTRIGAKARAIFPKAGVYRFKTVFGEDYKGMMVGETMGEDAHLTLTVTVS